MDSPYEVRERGDVESESKKSAETTAIKSHEQQQETPAEAVRASIDDGQGAAAMSSTEDWVRANHQPLDHDGRSPTRTYFDPRDVREQYPGGQKHRDPEDRRSWSILAGWQDGVQSDVSRGGQNWWADKQRWVDTFADQIGATSHHQDRCKYILKEMDITPYQSGHVEIEVLIVCILSLLVDNQINDFTNRTLARDGTKELLDDLNSDVNEYEHVRSQIKKNDSDLIFPD